MNAENLNLLIAALRSGDFKQGIDRLCTRNGDNKEFCCLGVGSVIAGVPMYAEEADEEGRDFSVTFGKEGVEGMAPAELIVWLGVAKPIIYGQESIANEWDLMPDWPINMRTQGVEALAPQTFLLDSATTLAQMNDSGMTFDQIADVLAYFGLRETAVAA